MNELLATILKDIDAHIYKIVDRRVSEVLQSHASLAAISDEFEDKMRVIAHQEVRDHINSECHHTPAQIESIALGVVENHDFSDALNDYDCSDTIADMVRTELDAVLEDAIADKLQETLGSIKFTAINTKEI